jgi:hypothetical protein
MPSFAIEISVASASSVAFEQDRSAVASFESEESLCWSVELDMSLLEAAGTMAAMADQENG